MELLRLRLLGGFACEVSGAVVELPYGMQRLVAFLALRGASHRSLVAGTLWPEVRESQALASLRTGVWRVNKLVPGILCSEGAGLHMAESCVVDAHAQEAFATSLLREHVDDPGWMRGGLPTLWLGELLPGWYDDWVVFERERLSQLRLHALELAARALTRDGELDVALELALEAVRTEPLRETANAVLISVYLAEGNASDAIHQFTAFSDLLRRELGLEPSPRLAALLPRQRSIVTRS
jgi:DNA-binding SARP family transcriptional activator